MAKAKKVTKAKGKEVAVSAKAREHALCIMVACDLVDELRQDIFAAVRTAMLDGCTFEAMEAAQPELKQRQAYRSAKSALVNGKKEGISLVNGDGSFKGRTALEKEVSAKRDSDAGSDKSTGSKKDANKAKYAYTDKHGVLIAAFAFLKAEPTLRKAYRVEVMEAARALANDEASVAPVRKPKSVARPVGAQSAPKAVTVTPMSTAAQRKAARKSADSIARQAAADAAVAPQRIAA
jgi:hypothetical protein